VSTKAIIFDYSHFVHTARTGRLLFSYEGQRLLVPQVLTANVPAAETRQNAAAAMQPYLNAFPIPNGPEYTNAQGQLLGWAPFNASFSNTSHLDAYSLRLDHEIAKSANFFVRYSYAPSASSSRASNSITSVDANSVNTQALTVGTTWTVNTNLGNDARLNYSTYAFGGIYQLDNLGGAEVPSVSVIYPGELATISRPFSFNYISFNGYTAFLQSGVGTSAKQRQFNLVDSVSWLLGAHQVKFGIDYRRLFPTAENSSLEITPYFFTQQSVQTAVASSVSLVSLGQAFDPVFTNVSLYVQDTWRLSTRLNVTYGARWEINPSPRDSNGINPIVIANTGSPSTFSVAPPGSQLLSFGAGKIAPRLGAAYELRQNAGWETVLRGGVGMFYDSGTDVAGRVFNYNNYPFQANTSYSSVALPLASANLTYPALPTNTTTPPFPNGTNLSSFASGFTLPYTLEWNVAVEQGLGSAQSLLLNYIGAAGRSLPNQLTYSSPNSTFNGDYIILYENHATSDYDALQVRFTRNLTHGLQLLSSYTWAHSIDDVSDATTNTLARGPSNMDIRHTFSAAATYDIPGLHHGWASSLLRQYALDFLLYARSAPPLDLNSSQSALIGDTLVFTRPDVVTGMPFYLYGSQYPGGKRVNPAAFTNPAPGTEGDLGRNALRGFGATQLDIALRRDFAIADRLHLLAKVEAFNVLNHPNFYLAGVSTPAAAVSTQTLATALSGGGSGLSSLYALGGPRSLQLSLKLTF
jgi:hypothetical protein